MRCRYLKNKRAYLLHLPRFLHLLHASVASVHGATGADAATGAGCPGGGGGQEAVLQHGKRRSLVAESDRRKHRRSLTLTTVAFRTGSWFDSAKPAM